MLDAFNWQVRRTLLPSIQRKSRHNRQILKHTLLAAAAACFPYLAFVIPRSLEGRWTWEANALYAGSQVYCDLSVACLLQISLLIGQLGHGWLRSCRRWMAITVQAVTFCLAACAVLLPWPACVLLSEGNSMLPFAPVAALMVLNVLLLRPLWWPQLSQSQTSTVDKTVEAPAVRAQACTRG